MKGFLLDQNLPRGSPSSRRCPYPSYLRLKWSRIETRQRPQLRDVKDAPEGVPIQSPRISRMPRIRAEARSPLRAIREIRVRFGSCFPAGLNTVLFVYQFNLWRMRSCSAIYS